jgi:hypothetical protein
MIKARAHKGGVRIGKTPKKLASICCPCPFNFLTFGAKTQERVSSKEEHPSSQNHLHCSLSPSSLPSI